MPRVYHGTTSKERMARRLRRGSIPPYTWFTDDPEEAKDYAKSKVKGAHGYVAGGVPIVFEAEIPDNAAWQLGGSGKGLEGQQFTSKYYKTSRRVKTDITEIDL